MPAPAQPGRTMLAAQCWSQNAGRKVWRHNRDVPTLPKVVHVYEVGPRDGLQNEPTILATDLKVELINRLSATGLATVEASSFVRPDLVPQLADAAEVMSGITRAPGVR